MSLDGASTGTSPSPRGEPAEPPAEMPVLDGMELNPFLLMQNPVLLQQMLQQCELMAQMYMQGMMTIPQLEAEKVVEEEPPKDKKEDAPLDLSRKSVSAGLETVMGIECSDAISAFQLKLKRTAEDLGDEKAGYMLKRNYSQSDLNAAVADIRCGRLGTRRASVVYGIPRSTLRNKIYKLEAAEELAGIATPFKRRKPGGQSSAEKRLADAVEKEKKCPTPMTDRSSESPSNSEAKEEKEEATSSGSPEASDLMKWEQFASGNDWTTTLWQTIMGGTVPVPTPPKERKREKAKATAGEAGPDGEWKKSRPKRGQYRKYDKVALDEAVKSVRRGEMSVHRAGSYYGVPHSTLEYKVKERNLLRNKRKKEEAEAAAAEAEPSSADSAVAAPAVVDLLPAAFPTLP